MAASMPMLPTTIINPIRVSPFCMEHFLNIFLVKGMR